jgi:hypothetical protein
MITYSDISEKNMSTDDGINIIHNSLSASNNQFYDTITELNTINAKLANQISDEVSVDSLTEENIFERYFT